MKTKGLYATIVVTLLVIFLPQNSNCKVKKNERILFPPYEKSAEVETNHRNNLKEATIQNTYQCPKGIQVIEFTHETPTLDKKIVLLKVHVFWEISELEKYQKNIKRYNSAKNIVWNFTEEAIRRVIIAHKLKDIVKRSQIDILEDIRCWRDIESEAIKFSNKNLLKDGIKIVNLEAKINYPI